MDDDTRNQLAGARREDCYVSGASPLGIRFKNFRNTSSGKQLRKRAEEGRPGAPCTKKFLVSNTEFTKEPICTASNQYQALKIAELKSLGLPLPELDEKIGRVIEKECLCEGLSATAPVGGGASVRTKERAVAVCPGPNLAYFSRISSLDEMVGHIYGRVQLLTNAHRPNMFIQELHLYVDYLKNEIRRRVDSMTEKDEKYFRSFTEALHEGIAYYKYLIPNLVGETEHYREVMFEELMKFQEELSGLILPAGVGEPVLVRESKRG